MKVELILGADNYVRLSPETEAEKKLLTVITEFKTVHMEYGSNPRSYGEWGTEYINLKLSKPLLV